MTGKAARVALWPSAARTLSALLDDYEAEGHHCFEDDTCEYYDGCNKKAMHGCREAEQFQKVKERLHKAGV